ncbi:METTL17 [Scenedesmus sp. PABB004]|nr:METTL17 [Scenedesmus sp. PABB004]
MLLLAALSRAGGGQQQWRCWAAARALSAHVVSAEAAQAVSQYGRGLEKLPGDMVATLEGYFKGARRAAAPRRARPRRRHAAGPGGAAGGGMTREQLAEEAGMEAELEAVAAAVGPEALLEHRRRRATAAAAAALPLPRTKSGRLKSSAVAALLTHIEAHGVLDLPHEHVRAALGLPPSASLSSPAANAALAAATPRYSPGQALALLDFGAGPGTAAWAAIEAWPGRLSRVTAVEPSHHMRRLGERVEAARRFSDPQHPLVRWRADLPPAPRNARKHQAAAAGSARGAGGVHDMVVAAYVLNELPDPHDRAALVRHLWDLTGDTLVLIEPGTPAGADTIQDARRLVLEHEQRRAAKLARRAAEAAASAEGGGAPADPNLARKLDSKWFGGAHVAAPCPHDGPCPLSAPGARAWCHFGTRFQRPRFMQAAKAGRGEHVHHADHQDERYAYVVLRRGARPAAGGQLVISRSFQPGGAAAQRVAEGPGGDGGGATGDEAEGSGDNAEGSSEYEGGAASQELRGFSEQQAEGAAHYARVNARLGAFGEGLVTRLVALEDAGVDWAAGGGDALPPAVAAQAAAAAAAAVSAAARARQQRRRGARRGRSGRARRRAGGERRPAVSQLCAQRRRQQQHEEEDARRLGPQGRQRAAAPPDEVELAAAASTSWARIIRPPRRRGGTSSWTCAAAGRAERGGDGQLERHVVARSDAKGWMGAAVYDLASDAQWGDLWPSFYAANNPKRQVMR